MSLTVTFSNSITFTVINQCGNGALINIEPVFRAFPMSSVERASQTRAFRHLSKRVFRRR